jgi:tetratricopeptide (TPR) repeat protein
VTPWLCGVFLVLSALPALCAPQAGPPPAQPAVLGRISFPNSGAAAAQAPFVRGVLLLHSFEYDDAIAAFREAQQIDPGFALAYWGEALSYSQPLWYNENLDKARAALNRLGPTPAARAAKASTAREKGYLDAVERLFGLGSKSERDRAYAVRMGALSRANPGDDEAAAFYALALLAAIPNGQRDVATSLKAGAIASAILKRNPQHPGAAHYTLHAYDDGEHAAMALEAARLYAKIAPASSHAQHMPSHAFLPLGLWDEASASDEAAWQTSVTLAKRKGLSAAQYDYHALGWLHYEYLQQGRFDKATEAMSKVDAVLATAASATPAASASHQHVESEIGRGSGPLSLRNERGSMRARFVVESGRWELMKGQGSFDNVDELFALGLASVKLGDMARAKAALEQLHGARAAAPDAANKQLAEIMYREVAGLYQLARGDRSEGLGALESAAAIEAEMPKPIARPYPVKPAGELYAETLLSTGDAAGALRAFQAALKRTPRRAASMIGLARAAAAAKQPGLAAKTAREFLAMWTRADAGRAEINEAQRLAGTRPGSERSRGPFKPAKRRP